MVRPQCFSRLTVTLQRITPRHLERVERIEALKGSGQILYGPQTLGGIMIDLLKRQGDGIREQHKFDIEDVTIKGQLNINSAHTLTAKYIRFEEDSLFSETGLTAQEYLNNPYSVLGSEGERYVMDRDTLQLSHGWKLGARG